MAASTVSFYTNEEAYNKTNIQEPFQKSSFSAKNSYFDILFVYHAWATSWRTSWRLSWRKFLQAAKSIFRIDNFVWKNSMFLKIISIGPFCSVFRVHFDACKNFYIFSATKILTFFQFLKYKKV